MKKGLIILLILLCLPVCPVKAAEAISFSTDSMTCKNNRLIEVNVNAVCDKKLSAALFEFTFDKSVLEFRGMKTPNGSKTVYNEKTDCVKLSYLCADGADISGGAPIFSLKFKSIGEGSTEIGFTVYDCVDADAQQITVGTCTAGAVNVTAKASDKSGIAESAKATAAPASSTDTATSTTESTATKTTAAKTKQDSGLTAIPPRKPANWTAVAVLSVSSVIAAATAGFLIGKRQNKKDKSSDSSGN